VAAIDLQLLPVTLCTNATLQDLSLWLYSLALLRITPSPLWCTSYVEASYSRLTARSTHPQVRSCTAMDVQCNWLARTCNKPD
jgi:hypothetical protein